MKPDFQLIRNALQIAIDSDPANRATYAKAKWDIDKFMTYRPTDHEEIKRINNELYALRQRMSDADIESILEDASYHLEKAEDEYPVNGRESNEEEEYYENKRQERLDDEV